VKKRLSFINAENFKNVVALQHYFTIRPKKIFKLLGQCSPIQQLKVMTTFTFGSVSHHTMMTCGSRDNASVALALHIPSE
jgi:hypothetical protein